jgi:hypothetical protein
MELPTECFRIAQPQTFGLQNLFEDIADAASAAVER